MIAVAEEFIVVDRVRDFRPAKETIWLCWDGRFLVVKTHWSERQGEFLKTRAYYVVELEVDPTWDRKGRGFRFHKRTGDSHDLFIDDAGRHWDKCNCEGGEAYARCLHRDCVRWLIDEGHL